MCFLFLVAGAIVLYANWEIPHDTRPFLFDDADSIPPRNVAMVLGTVPKLKSGQDNLYFIYRIEAAKRLYDAGKVKAFVVSGDNSRSDYNEPEAMKQALIDKGIPEAVIYLDYAGFRTLDSVVRMQKIFGQTSFIVVSQKFHNERAIFLAQHYGMEVYGYNATDLAMNRFSIKTKIREKLARVKVFVDLLIGKRPKFLGEPVEVKW